MDLALESTAEAGRLINIIDRETRNKSLLLLMKLPAPVAFYGVRWDKANSFPPSLPRAENVSPI